MNDGVGVSSRPDGCETPSDDAARLYNTVKRGDDKAKSCPSPPMRLKSAPLAPQGNTPPPYSRDACAT
jgi:hypothetical protein